MKDGQYRAKRAIQLFISVGFYPCYLLWRLVRRMVGVHVPASCVILYYHAVPSQQRQAFARQMDVLLRLTSPISIDPVPPLASGVRYSAVTFDDFFQSVVEIALPELKKRNIPCTLFVTTEVLGKYADWWPQFSPERSERIGPLELLQQFPTDLVAIGSHTLTHPKLPLLNERDARREISASRQSLEGFLNRKISTFSFPFGAFNRELIEWCRQSDYERIFTTLPVMAFEDPQEFVTGRVKADPTDWPLEFRLKLLGAYQWLPSAFTLKRRVLSFLSANKPRNLEKIRGSEA